MRMCLDSCLSNLACRTRIFCAVLCHRGKAMANYPQEIAQDAVCQSHTGHMTGLWFLPSPTFKAEY